MHKIWQLKRCVELLTFFCEKNRIHTTSNEQTFRLEFTVSKLYHISWVGFWSVHKKFIIIHLNMGINLIFFYIHQNTFFDEKEISRFLKNVHSWDLIWIHCEKKWLRSQIISIITDFRYLKTTIKSARGPTRN